MMLCLYCGEKNERMATSCVSCKRDISTPSDMPGHLGQVMKSAEKVQDGKISNEDFGALVKKMGEISQQVADEMNIPIDDDKAVAQTVSKAQKGVFVTLGALKEFNAYLDTEDKVYIKKGMAMIKQAYDLSRKSYGELEKLKKDKEAAGEIPETS